MPTDQRKSKPVNGSLLSDGLVPLLGVAVLVLDGEVELVGSLVSFDGDVPVEGVLVVDGVLVVGVVLVAGVVVVGVVVVGVVGVFV